MPLTQPVKDDSIAAQQAANASVGNWPPDVPERAALISQGADLLASIERAVVPPPGPVQTPDPLLIYDVPLGGPNGVGSLTAGYLYNLWTRWPASGGNWTDKTDTPQGPTPFARTTIKFGQSGPLAVDCPMPLVSDGKQTQLCLRAIATSNTAPQFLFNSRESATAPVLNYVYQDGTQETVTALADVACNTTTAGELGAATSWTVSRLSNVYLRFAAPSRTGVAGGSLGLSLIHVYDQGGELQLFDGTFHLAAPPPDTFTLKGDPRVFFQTQSFEDAPPYMKAMLFGDPAHGLFLDNLHQRNIITDETGSKVLQLTFDPHSNFVVTAPILFPNYDEAMEAAVEFEIRFMPDMLGGMTDGFKCFAGFSSSTKNDDAYFASIYGTKPGRAGTLLAGNGGAKSHGNDGWSARMDSHRPITPAAHPMAGHVPPMQYVYWPGQADFYGDPKYWNLAGFTPRIGEWHTYASRLRCNSVNADGTVNKDAELDCYIDSHLAQRWRGFYLRTTTTPIISLPPYNVSSTLAIGRIWMNTYHGGTAKPLARCSLQVRNVRAARFA